MIEDRPNPYNILRLIEDDDEKGRKKGKLKIFFGYAAGVGKTFAMLEAAHEAKKSGIDVVAGYIEPHTRSETMALLDGLEMLPNLKIQHRGISLNEFDLDGAIKRKPQLILVDELAHSNAEQCRHRKRYQDIKELLENGINVYTTINVQHIESLNDIVTSITGIIVRERVPDSIFDEADQVELVDIEPEDLIARLNQGKIYKYNQAKQALINFFTKDKLVALREIALRRTADAVNKKIEKQIKNHGNDYYTEEHILICLSSSPSNAKVIRTAARMASAFNGRFTALFVETTNTTEFEEDNKIRLEKNLKLAEQLGARIATVYGDDIAWQISQYAKISRVSKIVLGRSNTKKNWLLNKKTLVERLIEMAPNIDIYIIPDNLKKYKSKFLYKFKILKFNLLDVTKTIGVLILSTLLGILFNNRGYGEANIITIYILGILITSIITSGKTYGILASIFGVLAFNFLFTEPVFSLEIYDHKYVVNFLVMFAASIISSKLATKVKIEAENSTKKAYRTEILLETSQKLQTAKSTEEILNETAYQTKKLLDKTIILYIPQHHKLLKPIILKKNNDNNVNSYITDEEKAVAEWVFKNKKHAGATTNTLPGSKCLYLSIRNKEKSFAVIGIPIEKNEILEPFERNLLMAILAESALSLENHEIIESNNKIKIKAEQEKLRANLLRAISHDLRTPLTSISGNAGILMNNSDILSSEKRHELYSDIYDDSMWLINLVENLLSITRIENGTLNIKTEPELIDEVIHEALLHINRESSDYKINVITKDDLLMARMDSRLIIQVIINIVNNAIKYTPKGSTIQILSKKADNMIKVEVSDNGQGIDDSIKDKIFDMYFTINNKHGDGRRGLGLGLFLCKSIINAHNGEIYVKNNIPKGTVLGFTLQAEEVNIDE